MKNPVLLVKHDSWNLALLLGTGKKHIQALGAGPKGGGLPIS